MPEPSLGPTIAFLSHRLAKLRLSAQGGLPHKNDSHGKQRDFAVKMPSERSIITLALLLLAALLLLTTWGRFGDPFLDYGVTLYGPMLVARGFVPYRDFEWLYGPFSLMCNGALFSVFGIHNFTLLVANSILLILFSYLIHHLFQDWFDCRIAAAVLAVFFLCFAFSHSTKVGNYNYLVPYSSEALHGLYLGVVLVSLGQRVVIRPTLLTALLHGVVLALALLTKAEMAFAGLLTWLATYVWGWWGGADRRLWKRHFLLSGVGTLGILACIFCVCLTVMSPTEALGFVGGAWRMLATPAATATWNEQAMGLDAPLRNIMRVVVSSLSVAIILGSIAGAARLAEQLQLSKKAKLGVTISFFFAFGLILKSADLWKFAAYSLPLVAVGLVWYYGLPVGPQKNSPPSTPLGPLLWAVWSVGCISRMILNARIEQYGFVQAMPTVLLGWAWCLYEFPRVVTRRREGASLVRAGCFGLLFAFCVSQFQLSLKYLLKKQNVWTSPTLVVRLYDCSTDPRIPIWEEALGYLRNHLQPGDKLLVIPEGSFVAFALGRPMSTRTPQLTPTEVSGFGEANIVADFDRQRPDVVVIVHKHTQPFLFGSSDDYGRQIMTWVRQHYKREILFGKAPHVSHESFGVEILRRL